MNFDTGASRPYIRDIAYRSNFVPLQAPILLSYDAARAGCAPPDPAGPFRYLELGCGSGITLNGLAAAYPRGEFIGVDFNPANIAAARQGAAAARLANVSYFEAPFSALDARALSPVDYVACMGTWSWLPLAEKAAVVRLLEGCLREGGLLFLSFVTLGRASVTPMWQVLRGLVPDTGQGSMARVRAGIGLLAELRDHGAAYLQQNPAALALLNEVQAQDSANDLAALDNLSHNLLAAGFRAELLDDVEAALAPAGLQFLGAAAPYLNDADLAVPAPLRPRYDALPGAVTRAMFQDFLAATLIRADVFMRHARPDAGAARRYLGAHARAALTAGVEQIRQQLQQPGWTAFNFAQPVIQHVLERIAGGESGVADIARDAPFTAAEIEDAFAKLLATPGIELCFDVPRLPETLPLRVQPACAYNQLALEAASAGVPTVYMAAPGLGSCVPLTLPGSLLIAEICAAGTAAPADAVHAGLRARVERLAGLDPAAARQIADPQFFAQLQAVIRGRALPLLLRFGALTPAPP